MALNPTRLTIPRLNLSKSIPPEELAVLLNRWADSVAHAFSEVKGTALTAAHTAHKAINNSPAGGALSQNSSGTIVNAGSTTFSPTGTKLPAPPGKQVTLNNLLDGTSRFARTSVHSSHAPTTNPVTAHDAGSNVTINIASHTMQVGATAVSNNSGSVTALSYSTLYYVYYDDPTLAGGAVSYQATTTKTTAISGAGRFFVGSVLTPAATAPDTIGNGDGGTGAQFGSRTVNLCSTATPTATGTNATVTNPNNSIDGNLTTFASLGCNSGFNPSSAQLVNIGFPGITHPRAQTITLKVLSQVNFVSTTGTIEATVSYSVDGGVTFTNIYDITNSSRALTTDSVSIATSINPALVQVKVIIHCTVVGTAHPQELRLYEAWLEFQE